MEHQASINPRNVPVPTSLSREDFDGGPVSLDEIETRLWLGNLTAATDPKTIKEKSITHILTVDSCPLPKIDGDETFVNKYVQVSDVAKEDLLSELEGCIEFIANSLENKSNTVLVHCYFGVSRSAAVVIAYIMKKYSISYDAAFERVREKRIFVGPNSGFVQQLRLFQNMGFMIDTNNQLLKIYRLRLAANGIQKDALQPYDFEHLVQPDPSEKSFVRDSTTYRCRSCRRILADEANLLTHSTVASGRELSTYDEHTGILDDHSRRLATGDTPSAVKAPTCNKMYFMEPMEWMSGVLQMKQGKLHCPNPKCKTKLGGFDWNEGICCPCGTQVAPAFYAIPSKVEASRCIRR